MKLSTVEKGAILEDLVADYFKRLGYDVDSRVRLSDKFDVSHEIDVLARKVEHFGTLKIAVECKNVTYPIDIIQVRNFHDKLTTLNITKGIMVSTYGFTHDAMAHSKSYGIELWNLDDLSQKINQLDSSDNSAVYDSLPIDPQVFYSILPDNIVNNKLFSVDISILYDPYYFAVYRCFSQHNVEGNWVTLDSEGYVVIEATNGKIVSSKVISGRTPAIREDMTFDEYIGIKPRTTTYKELGSLTDADKIIVKPFNLDSKRAKDTAIYELVKALTIEYTYSVKRATKDGSYYVKKSKTLQPKKHDVDILDIWQSRIPTIYVDLSYKSKRYRRVIQGANNVIISDNTNICGISHIIGSGSATTLCEDCGTITCDKHTKKCMTCGTVLCDNCTTFCKTCNEPICNIHVEKCSICNKPLCNECIIICEDCKKIVCNKNIKKCSVCGKSLCDNCITSKGLVIKKYYCDDHIPTK